MKLSFSFLIISMFYHTHDILKMCLFFISYRYSKDDDVDDDDDDDNDVIDCWDAAATVDDDDDGDGEPTKMMMRRRRRMMMMMMMMMMIMIVGYFYTGDGAHRHKDGNYQITGRMDDVVNVSGHRLGTAELEDVIVSLIGVLFFFFIYFFSFLLKKK
jgi:acyl-CoA synthetase (AMP-forming)/AMP-acid ligase II